ncbi:MAG: hypothetical protein PHZ09_12810, partial [Eubacteriales bacterium]|nr:hypothetical protein [Eubacteriales bacterium]
DETSNTVFISQRMFQNALEFAGFLRKFYGYENAQYVLRILIDRNIVLQNTLVDIENGNEEKAAAGIAEWFRLSGQLTEQLAEMNPYWDPAGLNDFMNTHWAVVEHEMRYRLAQRGGSPEIFEYPESDLFATNFADFLAQGIIRQFGINAG